MEIVLENKQKHSVMFGKTEHFSQIVLQNKQKTLCNDRQPNISREPFFI